MDYSMDYTAAAKDEKTSSHQKDPAAFNLVAAYLKTAGSECADSNQQAYKADENLLAVMIPEQKLPGQETAR